MVAEVKYISALMSDKLGEISTDLLILHMFVFTALGSGNVHNSLLIQHITLLC